MKMSTNAQNKKNYAIKMDGAMFEMHNNFFFYGIQCECEIFMCFIFISILFFSIKKIYEQKCMKYGMVHLWWLNYRMA